MRVIAGKYRGTALFSPKDRAVRPTTDRVKESMFNLISSDIDGAEVLDLFAGSGALGIEALSRGASGAVFADMAGESLKICVANLDKVGEKSECLRGDCADIVLKLGNRGKKFDLIFMDPPYKKGIAARAVAAVAETGILNKGGKIIIERAREDTPTEMPDGYRIVDSRAYGASVIEIAAECTACAVTGTFDPFTLGHEYLVRRAAELFDVVYVVFLINPDKQPSMPLEKRMKLAKIALRKFPFEVRIDAYEGLAIDYCRQNKIKYIVRGLRNAADFEYESEMAKWNYDNGGVVTLFAVAKDADISSTEVRKRLSEHADVADLVDEDIAKLL